MILRDEYYLDGLNCDPFTFASECQELNSYYHKNQNFNEIKSHHYIISFDPKDRDECGLTGERAQQLGLTFAKKNFPGHQALICTHTDGHNESGNIHIHIVINSIRKYDVPEEPFMDCIKLICSLLQKEKSQKKNTGHNAGDKKNLISSTRRCVKMGLPQKKRNTRQRSNFSGMRLTMLQVSQNLRKNFQKSLKKSIVLFSKLVEDVTVTFTLTVKNILLAEILEPDMKKIFS